MKTNAVRLNKKLQLKALKKALEHVLAFRTIAMVQLRSTWFCRVEDACVPKKR